MADKILTSSITFEPLFYEGDKFKIVKINTDQDLMPIEAVKIKSGRVYGFFEGELN